MRMSLLREKIAALLRIFSSAHTDTHRNMGTCVYIYHDICLHISETKRWSWDQIWSSRREAYTYIYGHIVKNICMFSAIVSWYFKTLLGQKQWSWDFFTRKRCNETSNPGSAEHEHTKTYAHTPTPTLTTHTSCHSHIQISCGKSSMRWDELFLWFSFLASTHLPPPFPASSSSDLVRDPQGQ